MNSESLTQLVLGMRPRDDATFSNFVIAPENQQLVSTLKSALPGGQLIYLWGSRGSGRSHLLQAICHAYSEAGAPVLFLPLAEKGGLAPEILQQTRSLSLVCLDDISQIGVDEQWQEAVFHSVNEMTESGVPLVVSADCAPRDLPLSLKDLRSRLQRGLTFQLHAANDAFKQQILQRRAQLRGIELSDQVCDFILLRSDRSMPGLMSVLQKLDDASLERKRRVTVPLIKEIMNW